MTTSDIVGLNVDGYQIESIIGQGTVGVVYRAITTDQEPVAIKFCVPPSRDEGGLVLTRFYRETRIVARLQHPHIVPVLATGTFNEHAYMVMPLIKGESLADLLQRKERLNEIDTTEIGWQVADALFHVAEKGVIHRDVKPSNILITLDGHALLADFGVAFAFDNPALTQAGRIIGTPAYLAPELAHQSQSIDGRADLYSLGVMLYQMVTGWLPFEGTSLQMIHAHAYEVPPAPSTRAKVSPELEQVIMKALAKDPADRFPDGRTMARELIALNEQFRARKRPDRILSWSLSRWAAKLGFNLA